MAKHVQVVLADDAPNDTLAILAKIPGVIKVDYTFPDDQDDLELAGYCTALVVPSMEHLVRQVLRKNKWVRRVDLPLNHKAPKPAK